ERRLALGAMAAAGLKQVPPAWVDVLSAALSGDDVATVPDAVAAARRMALPKEQSAKVAGLLRKVAARATVPDAVRVEALAAIPGSIGELDPDLYGFLTARLSPQQPAAQRMLAA